MPLGREMGVILCLRVEGEAAGVAEKIRMPMRALWLVRACATIEEVGAPHMVRRMGCEGEDERKARAEGKGGRQRQSTRTCHRTED